MTLRTRLLPLGLALTAGLSGALILPSSPAAAALPGVVRTELSTIADSSNKSITVSCPFGTSVINASGSITNGGGSVMMDSIFPDQTLTSVTVSGVETDPIASNSWSITAIAICAPAPAGLEWNVQPSIVDSNDKSVTATCTGNRTLLGTGSTIKGSPGDVIMDEIRPNGAFGAPSTAVTVEAYEDDAAFAGLWSVLAYAICADPLAGQQTLWAPGPWDATNKGWYVKCDPLQVATGTGVEIATNTDEGEILIDTVSPNGSLVAAPTMNAVHAQEEDPVANSWGITAYVLCVDV